MRNITRRDALGWLAISPIGLKLHAQAAPADAKVWARRNALDMIRLVNTFQADYRRERGHYIADVAELKAYTETLSPARLSGRKTVGLVARRRYDCQAIHAPDARKGCEGWRRHLRSH